MRPVSSSKAESGAGRKLADESCIPNLLEFGVLVLCISKASPAFSIAALISVCLSLPNCCCCYNPKNSRPKYLKNSIIPFPHLSWNSKKPQNLETEGTKKTRKTVS
jgi:hypothetical protein